MGKIAVIFNTSQNKNTYRYEIDQLKVVDWNTVLGCCLWNSKLKDQDMSFYVGTPAYEVYEDIEKYAEKEAWLDVWKIGKPFASKVVKASTIEEYAECAIKSYMHTLNYDNLCCIIGNGKAKDIMQRISDLINDQDNFDGGYDIRRICMFGNNDKTIRYTDSKEKLTFIPCNDSYAYYNMENYYDELGFEVWNDYKLYEGEKENKTMKNNRMTEKKNSFDDDFVSKSDWLFGDDRQKLKSILDGMTIDEVREYLGYWWTLENVDASKGIYTFSRPVWGNIIVHTKKNKVQFVESRKSLHKSIKEGKTMKKNRMTERFNAPKDWDFEDMLDDYGMEYLQENDSDNEPLEMDMLGEIWNDPLEAITRTFYGGRWGFDRDSFNPNDSYFRVNGYGNGESIPYLEDYLKDMIDEESFYDWCVEQGYFESDEDDE